MVADGVNGLLSAQSSPKGQTRGRNRGDNSRADLLWNNHDFSDKITIEKGGFHAFRPKRSKSPELCPPPGGRAVKGL